METNKRIRLEEAADSLAFANKIVARFEGKALTGADMTTIMNAASQAAQAAATLNQLVGILMTEIKTKN